MLDCNFAVTTLDDVDLFSIGKLLHGTEKASRRGLYTVEYILPPRYLNARDYLAEVHFGENQQYTLFSGLTVKFRVENTMKDSGFNHNIPRGYLRPPVNFNIKFLG